jgi:DNA-binding LacI/PurR family transcriptional regulator
MELARQLGVGRETVRCAAEALQREGLLVKIRRRGTFTAPPRIALPAPVAAPAVLAYLQAEYWAASGQEEAVGRTISGAMLHGAMEEASRAGLELLVRRAPYTELGAIFRRLQQTTPIRGVIFTSYAEEKLLRRAVGLGIPTVLLDHDLKLPGISSVMDDSLEGARQAIQHLAGLGHRQIAFAHWHQSDLNLWRLRGYRQGLRDAGLPRRRQWEIATELTENGARRMVQEFLRLAPRPTALYCFNNTLARLAIEELRRHCTVPGSVSVVGGSGEEVAGLTCHQADWYVLGRTAVASLLRGLSGSGKEAPEHFFLPHTFRVGETTAPPASME